MFPSRFINAAAGLMLTVAGVACSQSMPSSPKLEKKWKDASVFELEAKSIDGKPVKFSDYKGKVILVVNVASRCGFTPQYKDLQELQEQYGDKGLVILGFPSNDFGGQEPGSASDIKQFCSTKYNVTFPMFAKVRTRPGQDQSEVYECLGIKTGKVPGWNFCKYVIGRDGRSVEFFDSRVSPTGRKMKDAVEKALDQPVPGNPTESKDTPVK
ncbi:MAG: glutathione peroxidase [Phycisphaerales bacterium]|nr:glutathione peroxidase [Phycisphaerales bacterium]